MNDVTHVKRWNFLTRDGLRADLNIADAGVYVLASDYDALASENERLKKALMQKGVEINGHQVQQLLEFFGGDLDTPMALTYWPSEIIDEDGDKHGPGLWVWCAEYPEDGGMRLLEEPPAEATALQPSEERNE